MTVSHKWQLQHLFVSCSELVPHIAVPYKNWDISQKWIRLNSIQLTDQYIYQVLPGSRNQEFSANPSCLLSLQCQRMSSHKIFHIPSNDTFQSDDNLTNIIAILIILSTSLAWYSSYRTVNVSFYYHVKVSPKSSLHNHKI
jgi:hypothetical protein